MRSTIRSSKSWGISLSLAFFPNVVVTRLTFSIEKFAVVCTSTCKKAVRNLFRSSSSELSRPLRFYSNLFQLSSHKASRYRSRPLISSAASFQMRSSSPVGICSTIGFHTSTNWQICSHSNITLFLGFLQTRPHIVLDNADFRFFFSGKNWTTVTVQVSHLEGKR